VEFAAARAELRLRVRGSVCVRACVCIVRVCVCVSVVCMCVCVVCVCLCVCEH